MIRWSQGTLVLSLMVAFAGCGNPREEQLESLLAWSPETMGEVEPQIRRQLERTLARLQSRRTRGGTDEELAEAAGQLAMLHHVYQNSDQALLGYELAERLDGADPRWPYYRGHLLAKLNRQQDAIQAFETALEARGDLILTRIRLAEAQTHAGDLAGAAASFEALPGPARDSARALAGMGELALANQDFERAADLFSRAREQQPGSNRIQLGLGQALREMGRIDEARAELASAGAVTGQDAELGLPDPLLAALYDNNIGSQRLWELGRLHLAAGRVEEAIDHLRRAVEIVPDREAYSTDLGEALAYDGDLEGAVAQYHLVLDQNQDYLPALAGLARVERRLHRRDDAIATYRRLLDLDDEHPEIHLELGDLYRVGGAFREATEQYRRAIDLDRSLQSAYVWLGWIQFLEADSRGSLETLREGLRHVPASDWLSALELRILSSLQDRGGAAELLSSAKERLRQVPVAFNAETLAMLYARAGYFAAARQWQEVALVAAGESARDGGVMRRRMEDYLHDRFAEEVLDRSDPAAAGMPLRRSDLEALDVQPPATSRQ